MNTKPTKTTTKKVPGEVLCQCDKGHCHSFGNLRTDEGLQLGIREASTPKVQVVSLMLVGQPENKESQRRLGGRN